MHVNYFCAGAPLKLVLHCNVQQGWHGEKAGMLLPLSQSLIAISDVPFSPFDFSTGVHIAHYWCIRMRRSAAPSQTTSGAPLTKRPKFHTLFTSRRSYGSSEEIATMNSSASSESVNHQCVSSLMRLTENEDVYKRERERETFV